MVLCTGGGYSQSYPSPTMSSVPPPNIAIIGGGIGGAFAAAWLRNASVRHLDVYEASERIGGRTLATQDQDETWATVELGASMGITENRYILEAARSLGLATELRSEVSWRGGGRLAIVGAGRKLAFEEGAWKATTLVRMLSRYGGRALYRLKQQGSEFIRNFSRIYAAQDAGRAFFTVDELLAVGGLNEWPQRSCAEAMAALFSDAAAPAATELVAGLMRNNYGQDWAPSGALCCFTAIAPLAAGGSAAAFGLVGGWEGLTRGLLQSSSGSRSRRGSAGEDDPAAATIGATKPLLHLNRQVTSVAAQDDGRFVLRFADGSSAARVYDHVVLAAPCPTLPATAEPHGESHNLLRRCAPLPYQHVYVTLVWGFLDPAYFGKSKHTSVASFNAQFSDLLVADAADHSVPFLSIGRFDEQHASPVLPSAAECARLYDGAHDGAHHGAGAIPRWKIFSAHELSPTDLAPLILCHEERLTVRHAWTSPGAYPISRPRNLSSFVLHESASGGLFLHPSALEAATSAMEVVAVAARNAALLLVQRLAQIRRANRLRENAELHQKFVEANAARAEADAAPPKAMMPRGEPSTAKVAKVGKGECAAGERVQPGE